MCGACCLVRTPMRRMKSRAWHRQISWSATGYGRSALFQMPTHFPSCIEGSKHSDVAVPTQGRRKGGILIATIFTASALCIWATGLRPLPDLPRRAEMTSTPASVSTREGPVETQAREVQKSSGRTEPYSQPTLSSHPENRVGADILPLRRRAQILPRTGPRPPVRRPLQNKRMAAT